MIDTAITSLVPVGSMLIANAMNTNGLALNRFRSDVLAHAGEIETALALGAEARNSVSPYVQASFEASLIPAIDSLRSLGIVWIPGLMAGMLLSGARPVYAANLPVRSAGDDFRSLGADIVDQHHAHSRPCIFASRAAFIAAGKIVGTLPWTLILILPGNG